MPSDQIFAKGADVEIILVSPERELYSDEPPPFNYGDPISHLSLTVGIGQGVLRLKGQLSYDRPEPEVRLFKPTAVWDLQTLLSLPERIAQLEKEKERLEESLKQHQQWLLEVHKSMSRI